MRRYFITLLYLVLISMPLQANSPVITKIGNSSDYLEILLANKIYPKYLQDVEYQNGSLYLLDRSLCIVFKIDFKTGRLLKTFFRKGQGPKELMTPVSLRVRDNKIFVLDRGFNGIKISTIEGKFVREFRVTGTIGQKNFDIAKNNDIFIAQYRSTTNTYIDIYGQDGKYKRSIIKIPEIKSLKLKRIHFNIEVDSEGNVFLLFLITKELFKFNESGQLMWHTKLENPVLGKYDRSKVTASNNGTINSSTCVFGFSLMENQNILVGHCGGGSIIDKTGKQIQVLTFEPEANLGVFEVIEDKLLNILVFGKVIYIYDITGIL